MIDISDPNQVEGLIGQLLIPDTNIIHKAEEILKKVLPNPNILSALWTQIKNSNNPGVRQLSAIILSKWIEIHFKKLDRKNKDILKEDFLTVLMNEPEKLVRGSIAISIGKICTLEIPNPGWMELLEFINQCVSHESDDVRELAFVLLNEMTGVIGDEMTSQFSSLLALYQSALNDPSPKVMKSAFKSISHLLCYIVDDDDVMVFKPVVPQVLATINLFIQSGDQSGLHEALDVVHDLCSSTKSLINDILIDIIQFMLQIGTQNDLDWGTKDQAFQVIGSLCVYKTLLISKSNTIPTILSTICNLVANSNESPAGTLFAFEHGVMKSDKIGGNFDGDDDDDDDDDDENDGDYRSSPNTIAQALLDQMALNLPNKYFYEPVIELCSQSIQSNDPNLRKAGIAILAIVTEGLQVNLRQNLESILPSIFQCAQDNESQVRECAAFCLGQFSEHCLPEIFLFAEDILPVVFNLLDDPRDSVQGVTCYVLEIFCENLESSVVLPFLEPLMERLLNMIQSTNNPYQQEMIIAAIGATALAAEKSFEPYLSVICNILIQYLQYSDENLWDLRGRALEVCGYLAVAVEKDLIKPYSDAFMQSSIDALNFNSDRLGEYTYAFWANMSKVFGKDFSNYYPELINHLIEILASADAAEFEFDEDGGDNWAQFAPSLEHYEDDDDDNNNNNNNFFSEDIDNDNLEDLTQLDNLISGHNIKNINTGLIDKKRQAIVALGSFALYGKETFYPYLGNVMGALLEEINHWSEVIRDEIIKTFPAMVESSLAALTNGFQWEQGVIPQLPNEFLSILFNIVKIILELIKDDPELLPVGAAVDALKDILEHTGMTIFQDDEIANDIINSTHMLLMEQSTCQKYALELFADYDEEEQNANRKENNNNDAIFEQDHDDVLIDGVADLLGAYAKVMGPKVFESLELLLPALLRFNDPRRPDNSRAMAIGVFGDLFDALNNDALPLVQNALSILETSFNDNSLSVRRNAAYALGKLATILDESSAQNFYPEFLKWVTPLWNIENKEGWATRDNGIACVSHMIKTYPNILPLDQILPPMLSLIPCEGDYEENQVVYESLISLLIENNDIIYMLSSDIFEAIAKALVNGKISDEIKQGMVGGLKASFEKTSNLSNELSKASNDTQNIISQALS